MSANKHEFLRFLEQENVLQFGQFTLNSGRVSPYFFNLGNVSSGVAYGVLGEAYAQAMAASGIACDVIFGPAYKGIPIAVATAIALSSRGVDVGVAYNRKEVKDHGEGGQLVGAPLTGRVVLIDDVLTSGKAIRGAVDVIRQTDASIVGAIIALDRQEQDASGQTAVASLARELAAPVISIANVDDVIRYLDRQAEEVDYPAELQERMRQYQAEYCVA